MGISPIPLGFICTVVFSYILKKKSNYRVMAFVCNTFSIIALIVLYLGVKSEHNFLYSIISFFILGIGVIPVIPIL